VGLGGLLDALWQVEFLRMVVLAAVVFTFLAVGGPLFLVLAERKISAWIQARVGPKHVGPHGILQTVADTVKLLQKESIVPHRADVVLFTAAPVLVAVAALLDWIVIPFAPGVIVRDLNVGILYFAAVSSLTVIGILTGGWASNNKYSLIGAMRAGAQIISYELSVILSLLTIVVLAGSLQLSAIIESQREGWWIFRGHLPAFIAFILFIIAGTAETNRGPFDLAEAESELTAGFHTEYSGLKFAFFFLAEFANMFIVCAIGATVFLGGWMPLHIGSWQGFNRIMDVIPPVFWFFGKVSFLIFLMMWFRWTFPRLRIDQLLRLEWKYLLPLNLMNLMLMALIALMGWHF
jgi:NADH-quinone oxidoreductase subunit H